MVCLGLEPGAAEWKAQMNPLSYGGTPEIMDCCIVLLKRRQNKNLKNVYQLQLNSYYLETIHLKVCKHRRHL